jgi:hypothetical protein
MLGTEFHKVLEAYESSKSKLRKQLEDTNKII